MTEPITVEVRATVAASPDEVFAALTQPELLGRWFWPFPTTVDVDPRVGGVFSFHSQAPELGVSGQYTAVVPAQRLDFIWVWDETPAETTRVSVELGPEDGGTALLLRHGGNRTPEQADDHRQGWADCLDRLSGLW